MLLIWIWRADKDVCWFDIAVNVALGVEALQASEQLQPNHYYSLNTKPTRPARILQFFETFAQNLHLIVVIEFIWAIWIQFWKAESPIFWRILLLFWDIRILGLILIYLIVGNDSGGRMRTLRLVLEIYEVGFEWSLLRQFHHVFYQLQLALEFLFPLACPFHLIFIKLISLIIMVKYKIRTSSYSIDIYFL